MQDPIFKRHYDLVIFVDRHFKLVNEIYLLDSIF